MSGPVVLARVIRSGVEEAVHLGSVAVARADGRLVAWAGDPDAVVFARSCTKPYQAAVSLSLIDEELTTEEIAVMCASHNAEETHLAAVRKILERAGLGEEAMLCPEAWPMDGASAREAAEPRPVFHECSGKHAGMLLACVRAGLDPSDYLQPAHPLQARVWELLAGAAGTDPVAVGVDGCGVPVHALPLVSIATLYARLAQTDTLPQGGDAVARAASAMREHPYLVAGRGRVCTEVMDAVPGVIVKVGSVGLIGATLLERGLGVAVKIADGAGHVRGPVLVHVLDQLGVLEGSQREALATVARPPVLGGGRVVGALTAEFPLSSA